MLIYFRVLEESSGNSSNSHKLFSQNILKIGQCKLLFIVAVVGIINVDKIINKRVSNLLCRNLKSDYSFSKLYWYEMGFSALACMKGKFRNRLNAMYAVRSVMLSHGFKILFKRRSFFVLRYSLFYLCLSLLGLVVSHLYFQRVFLNDFGSRKKRVEKHWLSGS